jgi:hypothetical protein
MDLDSNFTLYDQHLTGRELLDSVHTRSLSDRRCSYHFIARTMLYYMVSNLQMRRQYSLSQDAFRSVHSNLVHLLTVCELACVQVKYLSPYIDSLNAIQGDPVYQQSVYASLSIYSFVIILDGRVDTGTLDGLIGVDADAHETSNLMYAEQFVYEYWDRVRTLASPNFPLAEEAPKWEDCDEVDQFRHCLSSVLMEQAGIYWRPCQDEQNMEVSDLHQQYELISLSIWRQLGVDIYAFSACRRDPLCMRHPKYPTLMTRCQVCGFDDECYRQDGVWCCKDRCRQLDIPLDMEFLPRR